MEDFNKKDLVTTPQGLEQLLKQLQPNGVTSDSFDRMLDALDNPEKYSEEEDKVVNFAPPNRKEVSVFEGYSTWDAVKDRAIVAFEGYHQNIAKVASIAAVMVIAFILALNSTNNNSNQVGSGIDFAIPTDDENATSAQQLLLPDFATTQSSGNSGVVQVSNQQPTMLAGVNRGIIWDDEQTPHMCVKVQKIKFIPITVADGEIAFKQEPVVEYFLAPCTVD